MSVLLERSSMSQSYSKVTLTIEEEDGTTQIIEIPKASHIRIDTRGAGAEDIFGSLTTDLEIALTGSYSDKDGCTFRQTKSSVTKAVRNL